MNNTSSISYPIFNFKNESLILKSGQGFSMNELKSRLHQMEVDDIININSKSQMANLYDSTIQDDRNKIKLIDKLRKDTEDYSRKTGININKRRKIPYEENDYKNDYNNEKSKVINLQYQRYNEPSYEQNNNNNYRKQEIKLRRSKNINNNNNNNIRNPFKSNNDMNYNNSNNNVIKEQNEDTYYEENNNNNISNYNYRNTNNNNNYNNNNAQYSRNFQNNESGYSDLNNTNNYNSNYNNNNKIYTNEQSEEYNAPTYSYQPKNENINNYPMNNKINVKDINDNDNDNDNKEDNNIRKKSLDEESSFSILSSIKSAKKVCFYSFICFIIICIALLIYYLCNKFSDSIAAFFNQTLEIISHPGNIISSILDILCNYWYFIPIVLIIVLIVLNYIKRRKIKKLCEETMKKIVEDLSEKSEDEIRSISEEDIYRIYLQKEGISWNDYKKYYLPKLQKMRRNNKQLRFYSENIGGKNITFWEYNS